MYLWTNDLANQGKKTMEKKNINFTKDGMKVGVKPISEEEYADRTQRYGSLLFFALPQALRYIHWILAASIGFFGLRMLTLSANE